MFNRGSEQPVESSAEMGNGKLSLLLGILVTLWILCSYCETERIPKIIEQENFVRRGPTNISAQQLQTAIDIVTKKNVDQIQYKKDMEQKYQFGQVYQNKLCVVVYACQNEGNAQYKRILNSLYSQDYANFHIVYIDDASQDASYKKVHEYIKEVSSKIKTVLTQNQAQHRKLKTIKQASKSCDKGEIMIIMDGNSQLIGKHSLQIINSVMASKKAWFVWSQALIKNSDTDSQKRFGVGESREYPQKVIKNSSIRNYPLMVGGLQAFNVNLFKMINDDDFLDINQNFNRDGGDSVYSIPMLEMASERIAYIPELLYFDGSVPEGNKQERKAAKAKLGEKMPYHKITQLQ